MHEVLPLAPECPWADWRRPNIAWCEEPQCAWIVTPANTWTNLAYAVAALAMLQIPPVDVARRFAWAAVLTGACSFAYHASYTLFFQFFDFVGMFVFLALPTAMNMRRVGMLSASRVGAATVALVVVPSALIPPMVVLGIRFQILVALLVVFNVAVEPILVFKRSPERIKTGTARMHFLAAVFFILAAFACSVADQKNIVCNPKANFHGHSAWHCLSATSMYFMFRLMVQLDVDSGRGGKKRS